ncbi:DsbA family protein [Pseudodesulfovibrio methanolicus]|uniref:Thioredoxin-like fold domain-containing protein n=1 Tax=Pseudodesulfovibrio methanolicus TaxID=3126690 RepID=A0ABZ2IZP6_9BACT
MRKNLILLPLLIVALALFAGCRQADDTSSEKAKPAPESGQHGSASAPAEPRIPNGCSPEFRALYDNAVVELHGQGTLDVVVVTDPLCWHCRLADKLLREYPKLYGTLRLSFFPRRSFIGSDMAAWVLEDAAGTDRLPKLAKFAYHDLKQPKTQDLMEARMLVLAQFTRAFPELLKGTTIEKLYVRLQKKREPHVLESAMLARTAHLPGTPILVAGDKVVLGFGPEVWLKVLGEAQMCK